MSVKTILLSAGALWLSSCSPAGEELDSGRESAAAPENLEQAAAAPAVQSDLLVSTEWLSDHLDEPGLVLLHVGSDRTVYDRGHIPGARFLPVGAILTERDGVANELPAVAHLDSVFESVGVSDDARVIVYGAPLAAARAFFTLDYLGHGDRTALLDGGLESWAAESRALSTEAPRAVRGSFTPSPRPERAVDAQWVNEHRSDPAVALLDVRPPAQFTGAEAGGGVARPGHIPGAENLFWEETLRSAEHPVLKDPEALRGMFRAAGVESGDTVVTYCRTGMQSSFAYFVSRYLGYETRLYDGSFMDWSRRDELPVERSEARGRS